MNLIDRDILLQRINTHFWSEIEKIIISAPTIDAVEVVRCKDCRFWLSDGGALMVCDVTQMPTMEEHYCSYGEREDEPQTENHCDGCVCDDGKHLMYCMNCKNIAWETEPPKVESEPQTERSIE